MPSTPSEFVALIDCNNFFASCEQLFDPKLKNKPVVILSNNDGCIIARSREAKALGIKMGEPAFKNRALFEAKGVTVLSSNFALYGDISERVIATIEQFGYSVEVYSIDEAFVHLPPLSRCELETLGTTLRAKVLQWVGIPVAVGIAPTKTLAKMANELAKKQQGVCVLFDTHDREHLLGHFQVEEVWGIGRQLSQSLHAQGIHTVKTLTSCDDRMLQKHFSVMLVRTVWELRGIRCFEEDHGVELAKSITCSRSFGKKVTSLIELKEAVASYMAKAATRLRAQDACARRVHVFLCTDHLHSQSGTLPLPTATAYTPELIQTAHCILSALYRPGSSYKKAGVILQEIQPKNAIQPDLFEPVDLKKRESAMQAVDTINSQLTKRALRFASEGFEQTWRAKSGHRSPRFTTHWDELPIVK